MAPATEQPRPVRVLGRLVESYPRRAPEAERGRVLRVTVAGEPVLHRPLQPVTAEQFGSAALASLIEDMFATLYVAEGVGLAANQVDVDLRVFVYDCPDDQGVRHVGHLCNPEIDELPPGLRVLDEEDEGCLSVPGAYKALARPHRAVARGFDQNGNPLVIEGTGFFARCLQHESDHLDGYLYIDRLPKRERRDALKQMEALREEVFARRAAKAEALRG
ncbi:peptide deformylase [Actinocrinis puniceicyclus]|uniref:Peptide deformylase n=1 Tax=Actinocrinis puniceicyclus TaxID=977794 RepID=A0A8J8BEF0_9ACTN|nr:peptide deformylase [Actinocrinis puniceicyclus]MBS2966308.1 peptide deformylase [Actinocrinis puniceicyclus]